ncbi:MAG TPA: 16S rRNA (cytosine(967)-C(5))-methyltransferase RsmB [Vicinamibacterales bacterium]|nr:16S rRNA (cytosine(967)-C(5))-methyltransferase RsmB [Vicinamibacterales bacterium]
MTAPARTAAYHAVRAITAARSDLPTALHASREHLRDDRDRSLAAEIVTGTLRWQRSLDHLIEHYSKRRIGRLDPEVVAILRLSLYQLLHLDRVPASAVVDDAVDLTRAARKPSASGFVNAVLRATLRQKHKLPLPGRPEDTADRDAALAYLGVTHSHPDWLVARWLDRYGFEATERWVRFNNETPPLTVRVNRLRATREQAVAALAADDVETQPTRYAPDGLVITSGNPLRRPADGLVFVQDEASQLVPMVAAVLPNERVLDLCASPGGKTIAMAADMEETGTLVASDVRPRRLALLRDTVRVSGARSVNVVRVPTDGPLPFGARFDAVLVDAPCSGLGTIRRDPDIRWRRREDDLPSLARDQVALLMRAADVVRPGGRLVYATCSSEPEENDGVIAAFVAARADFRLADPAATARPVVARFIDPDGFFRTTPPAHGLEAFFAALLIRA